MLLRNKRTGFEYAYSTVLANDPEFELIEDAPIVVRQEQPAPIVIRKRVKRHGNEVQRNPE